MAIYMKIEGIEGNATAKGHEKWIPIDSFQMSVGRSIRTRSGATKDREATKTSISEIVVTKTLSEDSAGLFQEVCVGASKAVEIHFCKTGTDQIESYCEIKLEEVLVSGYSLVTQGERPVENLALNFTKITYTYKTFDEKHKAAGSKTFGYDLVGGQKI